MIGTIFLGVTLTLLLIYCVLISLYRYWFSRLTAFQFNKSYHPVSRFSIIIPARDEEENIEECLLSVLLNHYPKNLFEVIVIDDESTDDTVSIIKKLQLEFSNLKLMHSADLLHGNKVNSYKKMAIEAAIKISTGDMIVTTDADCIIPENWLANFDNYAQQSNKKFIAAPVAFSNNHTFLSVFQCLDFLSLQGITAASVSAGFHSMCNGANLCYNKELFLQVNGFEGIDQLASGDDMLLMHKIEQTDASSIGYLFSQESIVVTQPMLTWNTFINQRIRWASKATVYTNPKITLVLWLVYLLNLFLLLDFVASCFQPIMLWYWFGMLVLKTIVELLFMYKIAAFFHQKALLKWFPEMQPFHIFYTIVAGFLGKFGTYKWKGRNVQ